MPLEAQEGRSRKADGEEREEGEEKVGEEV